MYLLSACVSIRVCACACVFFSCEWVVSCSRRAWCSESNSRNCAVSADRRHSIVHPRESRVFLFSLIGSLLASFRCSLFLTRFVSARRPPDCLQSFLSLILSVLPFCALKTNLSRSLVFLTGPIRWSIECVSHLVDGRYRWICGRAWRPFTTRSSTPLPHPKKKTPPIALTSNELLKEKSTPSCRKSCCHRHWTLS